MTSVDTQSILRMIGVMAIAVALAWAFQVLGLGGSTAFGRLMWIVGAATIAGAGTGLLYGAAALRPAMVRSVTPAKRPD